MLNATPKTINVGFGHETVITSPWAVFPAVLVYGRDGFKRPVPLHWLLLEYRINSTTSTTSTRNDEKTCMHGGCVLEFDKVAGWAPVAHSGVICDRATSFPEP